VALGQPDLIDFDQSFAADHEPRQATRGTARRAAARTTGASSSQGREAGEASGCPRSQARRPRLPDPSRVLKGVHHPDRLLVHDPCRKIAGSVEDVRHEEDGDIHILVRLDPQYRGMLMANNRSEQHGDLVVEFMPRDYGDLPRPNTGDRLVLVGAYVDDTEHGWAEPHPIWGVSINGGPVNRSGPQFGGSPAYARSANAVATCRTNTGARCRGYTPRTMRLGG
jgi:hypothetical protein